MSIEYIDDIIVMVYDKNMRYAIYCRKSSESEDRQILSLDSQIEALNTLAEKIGADVIKVYRESMSAKAPDQRPLFNELTNQIKDGLLDGILCWDINRLSRNPVDSGMIQWLLQNNILKEIVTPYRTYKKDDTGLIMSVELGTANQFILDLSKNVKRGLLSKANKGWLPNGCKPGYMNDKYAEKGNKTILSDPVRFPIIKEAWNMLLTGKYSPPQILVQVNKMGYRSPSKKTLGGKPMARSQIYRTFHDPFYYGSFEFPVGSGQYFQGKHQPMITKEEFDKAQILLGNKVMPNAKDFTYSGMFKCGECGCQITVESKRKYYRKTNRVAIYNYHHCTHQKTDHHCKQRSIEEQELEKQINSQIKNISIPISFAEFARDNLKYLYEKERAETREINKSGQEIQDSISKQLDRLLELALYGAITQSEYSTKKTLLQKELSDAKNISQKKNWYEEVENVFNISSIAKDRYQNGDKEAKRDVLRSICSNLTIKDKKVTLHLEKPFLIIKEAVDTLIDNYDHMLEPQEKYDPAIILAEMDPQNPTWLPRVDSDHEP